MPCPLSFPLRSFFILGALLLVGAALPAQESKTPALDIQKFVNEAIAAGKGEVIIPPGTWVLEKGLFLKDAKNVTIAGLDREACILKLPPVAYAECTQDTAAGGTEIPVTRLQNMKPGVRLRIEAPGAVDSFTKKPTNYHLAKVKAVAKDTLLLEEPLKYAVPAKTTIRDADAANVFEIRGATENVTIRNLTIDGGRAANDPVIHGHAELTGVHVAGPYTYEKGPTGPRIKGVTIDNCIIQNCFGRGVSFYSVENSSITRCTFMDISDEAINFDHFSENCVAKHNHIARARIGFELNDAIACIVEANEVRDCGIGVNLWRWCKQENGINEKNKILNNLFTGMEGNAVQFGKNTKDNEVKGNEIVNSGKNGISLNGTAQKAEGNQISGTKGKAVVE
ncbi:parallel beta helix pectate lyase-like protein [Roseimicrobium gellanilyticum]|uniref:Parallel beta helix pectate lyase-like protein n=1 Tax=Roseimicrobium gellanilyticum TaxID=748857 RepID=A0A366HDX8_9BACT|nr:right-handed parallel beta-helix repeat-containing protein [Roseimicrobium gellanilyticum]RBP39824.1 parallel beta helix pectate lyase-like protein [Roseimicrobium gellanilyticum]